MAIFLLFMFLWLIILSFILSSPCDAHEVLCRAQERKALLDFKNGLSGYSDDYFIDYYYYYYNHHYPKGKLLASWVSEGEEDCCKWEGIGCDNRTGHVTKLVLVGARGNISPSLARLRYLQHLDLHYGDFGGSPIPEFMGSFPMLMYLDLSYANFTGVIPPHLGNLSMLQVLNLSSSYSYMPSDWKLSYILRSDGMWLSHLSSLQYLVMNGVNLTEATSLFRELNKLPFISYISLSGSSLRPLSLSLLDANFTRLSFLDVSFNSLSGSIPESIGGIKSLEYLYLSHNELDGHIPMSIGELHSCYHLVLSYNNLSGIMPSSFGQLYNLQYLDLSHNSLKITEANFINFTKLDILRLSGNSIKFVFSQDWVPPFSLSELYLDSCNVGPQFPSWIQSQKELYSLNVSSSSMSDVLPQWIWNFSSRISYMDLSINRLGGKVPIAMNESSNWRSIDIHNNRLEGSLSSFPVTKELILSNNLISGPINLRNISAMSVLNLSMNDLSGMIPSSLCDSDSLGILDLSNNHLYGQLPSCMRNSIISNSCGISMLYLNNNILEGTLPTWFGNCTDMISLYIGNNKFTGNLPRWTSMPKLRVLSLSSNSFNGSIPSELSSLEYLIVLDLANNHFSGNIPYTFSNFTAMKTTTRNYLYWQNMYIEVTLKGEKLGYCALDLQFLRSIDLSGNEISGEIPEDLGELHGLINLNLSGNHLTGNIPRSFSDLVQLESLDLSRNNLSGGISQSLRQLTYLSSFNVSFNNLSGRIPTGNQFDTFNSSSYLGNMMLCGKPLETCGSLQQSESPTTKKTDATNENNNYYLWLYTSLEFGCFMGFWIFWGILLLKRSWRHRYFQFIDRQCRNFICLLNGKARNV